MKPYTTDKSHFDSIVKHNEIHLFLENLFTIIDKSAVYINDSVEEINIRYNGMLFKIFCQNEKKHIKGKEIIYLRLNSFFPIENKEMLDRLNNEFKEKQIDSFLNIFIKI